MAYANLEKRRETTRARLKRFRERRGGTSACNRVWNSENREKYLAHKAVQYAIKAGKLLRQPCERCGVIENIHAHHEDYSKRLEVNWLCPVHHKQRHAELALGSIEQALPKLGALMDIILRHEGFSKSASVQRFGNFVHDQNPC